MSDKSIQDIINEINKKMIEKNIEKNIETKIIPIEATVKNINENTDIKRTVCDKRIDRMLFAKKIMILMSLLFIVMSVLGIIILLMNKIETNTACKVVEAEAFVSPVQQSLPAITFEQPEQTQPQEPVQKFSISKQIFNYIKDDNGNMRIKKVVVSQTDKDETPIINITEKIIKNHNKVVEITDDVNDKTEQKKVEEIVETDDDKALSPEDEIVKIKERLEKLERKTKKQNVDKQSTSDDEQQTI